ncbi:hypothetical protein [Methylobacterium nigriterrae]|uniref:hypothetical protein n=1 Tax=Methylobacterium nigriterrae TaxID=3127512 RepID=UPI0030137329
MVAGRLGEASSAIAHLAKFQASAPAAELRPTTKRETWLGWMCIAIESGTWPLLLNIDEARHRRRFVAGSLICMEPSLVLPAS